jgi:hypothetical protein
LENNRYKGPCVGSDEETEINKMQKRLEKNEVIRLYSTVNKQLKSYHPPFLLQQNPFSSKKSFI